VVKKLEKFWQTLGPGVITGASDDDTSAIATYSVAGARFGNALLWVMVFILPFMIAVQEMSARIGALSGCGLAGNLKRHYHKFFLFLVAIIIVFTNILNVGSNIYGMAGAMNLILPIPIEALAIGLSGFVLLLMIVLDYEEIVLLFKWLSLSLCAYVVSFFTIHASWLAALKGAFIPHFQSSRAFVFMLFAVAGTTISPYLYFWQASEEAEETKLKNPKIKVCKFRSVRKGTLKKMELDTKIGMLFSNVISFFVMALTAATLFNVGNPSENLRDIAQALKPLAGDYAYLLFTAGIVGSGLLAIPVLAGSAAYVITEIFGWKGGFQQNLAQAKEFYLIIIFAIIIGLTIPFLGINPLQALLYTSVLNGAISPILIMFIIHMANNPKIVGQHISRPAINYLGYATFFLMITGTFFVLLT